MICGRAARLSGLCGTPALQTRAVNVGTAVATHRFALAGGHRSSRCCQRVLGAAGSGLKPAGQVDGAVSLWTLTSPRCLHQSHAVSAQALFWPNRVKAACGKLQFFCRSSGRQICHVIYKFINKPVAVFSWRADASDAIRCCGAAQVIRTTVLTSTTPTFSLPHGPGGALRGRAPCIAFRRSSVSSEARKPSGFSASAAHTDSWG